MHFVWRFDLTYVEQMNENSYDILVHMFVLYGYILELSVTFLCNTLPFTCFVVLQFYGLTLDDKLFPKHATLEHKGFLLAY